MANHGRLIDADALEKDGWIMYRIVPVDKNTMSYQIKKPTDFPTIEPECKMGKWVMVRTGAYDPRQKIELRCSECGAGMYIFHQKFCHGCGLPMKMGACDDCLFNDLVIDEEDG